MKIAIVGTGYVGLVTGTCFAESGNEVTCIDNSAEKIATLQRGGLPIYEPGLLEMVERNRREERLSFTTNLAEGIAAAQLVFIAVGTPQRDDGSADLRYVDMVTDDLCAAISSHKIVVIKSTVPPGTNRRVCERFARGCKHPVEVCSNPEFLREGAAIEDCLRPDRVVVGLRSQAAAELFHELYLPFVDNHRPLLVMTPESAEMTKYAANAILATKISYINEVANLCERVGADVSDVQLGIGHDNRIGFQFLSPGVGYGGSCFEANETVFVHEGGQLTACTMQNLFERTATAVGQLQPALAGASGAAALPERLEVCEPPAPLHVLGFDLERRTPVSAAVQALTRRPYTGAMIQIKTGMGRTLRVTADHPMILWTPQGSRIVRADQVEVGDKAAALTRLPELESQGRAAGFSPAGTSPAARLLPAAESEAVVPLPRAHRDVVLEAVREVQREETSTVVYSLETSTGTVVAASGLVCHNCFPKDTRALITLSKEHGVPSLLMEAVDRVNESQKRVLADKVRGHFGARLAGRTLAVWGLAFKPRTDDIREAPALVLLKELLDAKVHLRVHDPEAMANIRREFGDQLVYCDRPYGALEGADGLVIVTEWQTFRTPDFEVMRRLLAQPVIFDGRNLYDPRVVAEAGFTYHSIGRQTATPHKR
jgi:UDP-glucose 6-dehydrogenase